MTARRDEEPEPAPAPATSSLLGYYCASLVPSPIQFQIW